MTETVERRDDLHGDLLSFGNAARQGRVFLFSPIGGTQAQKSLRSSAGGGDEGRTVRQTGTEETPLPSCLWRDSRPGHTAQDLMSARKQVF
jgi:hypothetical protein